MENLTRNHLDVFVVHNPVRVGETNSNIIMLESESWTVFTHSLCLRAIMPTVLFGLSFVAWTFYHTSCSGQALKLPLPPGSLGLPIIGETLSLAFQGCKFFDERLQRYGSVYKTHLLGSPVIRVCGPENVKKILLSENNLVSVYWPASVRALLGDGTVSNAFGNLHRTRRRALQKAFSHEALADYVPIMRKVIKDHISIWCSQDIVHGYQECKNMAFAVSAETLVGFNMGIEEHNSSVHLFDVFVDNLFCLPFRFPGLGFAKGMSARKKLLDKIGESLRVRKLQQDTDHVLPFFQDAISRLLDVQGEDSLTDSELKDLCLELLFAGHSTTASASTSLLLNLIKHRNVLAKIQEELNSANLGHSEQGDLTMSALNQMEYISAVVKEVLRLSPPVGGAYRTVLKTFSLNGYQIPAGWTLAYSIRDTQRISELFPNSSTFDPDRWIDHSSSREEKFHYLPFGGGTRSCVGKEFAKLFLKIFVIELVRSCSWRLMNDKVTMNHLPVPHPADGLPLGFSALEPSLHDLKPIRKTRKTVGTK
ncbi:cytochrome p450 26a1 [Plakobranchus ocellatus]|uniref:Cytochrome p450 26a1 n=1 Tax=Plakobranchus ocellatus TaxID=259542 RepID=A0AAV3ZDR1_9GAST|nr:cytochrome p450 26a1 [Plakobranchus ocellatus]